MVCASNKYSKTQWLIFIVYSVAYFLETFLTSFIPPFYPLIAEKKGVTPTQIGLVFGTFTLTKFFFSLFGAEMIKKFEVTSLLLFSVFATGIINILFGFIEMINGTQLFLGLSIVVLTLESLGASLIRNVTFSVVSFEFAENIEMAFAFIQLFYSFALMLGPLIGGALVEVGGFVVPFATFGVALSCLSIPIGFLHNSYPKPDSKLTENIVKLLPLPAIIFALFTMFGSYFNDGFIITTLEIHLKDLNLSPVQLGLVFFLKNLAQGISVLGWSKLCEKYDNAGMISFISSCFNICGLILLGPAPYLSIDKNIYSLSFGLIFNSSGIGGGKISSYSLLNRGSKIAGLSKSIQTYGLISSIYTSILSLGHVFGTYLGGFLFETFGFGWSSHFYISYHLALCAGAIIYFYHKDNFSNNHENLRSDAQDLNYGTQAYENME